MSSMIDHDAFSRLMRSTFWAGVSFTGVRGVVVSAVVAVGPVMSLRLGKEG